MLSCALGGGGTAGDYLPLFLCRLSPFPFPGRAHSIRSSKTHVLSLTSNEERQEKSSLHGGDVPKLIDWVGGGGRSTEIWLSWIYRHLLPINKVLNVDDAWDPRQFESKSRIWAFSRRPRLRPNRRRCRPRGDHTPAASFFLEGASTCPPFRPPIPSPIFGGAING